VNKYDLIKNIETFLDKRSITYDKLTNSQSPLNDMFKDRVKMIDMFLTEQSYDYLKQEYKEEFTKLNDDLQFILVEYIKDEMNSYIEEQSIKDIEVFLEKEKGDN
tara:strand:+ start:190 stop:504 length:315 start_codon:yes stop_codon:yes gene_type:complete